MRTRARLVAVTAYAAFALISVPRAGATEPEASAPPKPAASAAAVTPSPASPEAAALARFDELWKRRDDLAALAEMKQIVDRAVPAAPNDYPTLWRAAAYYFWVSDGAQSRDDKTKLGKTGWDIAERAAAAKPEGVEGQFYAAATMGNYSLGIGILRALAQRMEGKFVGRLQAAERIDPKFAAGAIAVAWGRYWAQLPWPKYDKKKAVIAYQRALEINPHNLRARVYWAELSLEEKDPALAKKLLDEVAAASVGRYDGPEERRAKALGAALAPKLAEALKR